MHIRFWEAAQPELRSESGESCHWNWLCDLTLTIPTNMSSQNQSSSVASGVGTIGAIFAAMSCAACFPALATLASALGLGFLSQFESVSINYLLPLLALVGLAANVIGGLRRFGWVRMILGVIGPLLVLAAALLMSTYGMPTEWLLYPGLVIMVGVAIWDLRATHR